MSTSKRKKYIRCRIHGFSVKNEIENIFSKIDEDKNSLVSSTDKELLDSIAKRAKKKFLSAIYYEYKNDFETKDVKVNEFDISKDILTD